MATLRITDQSGSNRASLDISRYQIRREGFNVLVKANVIVDRSEYNATSGIVPGQDRAYIELSGTDVFGGVLRAPQRQGSKVKLKVRGFGQYLDDAPPVQTGSQKIAADDSTLIKECIDAASNLGEGVIETVEAGQTWVFGGVTQWQKAAKVANAAGGELKVTPDRLVHYQAMRGQDKTDTTLSPGNASFVENTFVANRDGVTGNTTHLHVTGVGQGTAQIEVALVPDDDTASYSQYDTVVTYQNDGWSDGDPARWAVRSNKELKNESAAKTWARNLIGELNDTELRVETVVKSDYVELGDRFHVTQSREGVDDDLRAVEVTEIYTPDGGRRFETVFSNYSVAHSNQVREDHKNAERYGGSAYEGDLTNIQQGPGRGPVNSGHDYILSVYYPDDVVAEVDAQMNISGLNYRAYASGTASNGNYSQQVTASDSGLAWTCPDASTWKTVDTFSTSQHTSEMWVYIQFAVDTSASDPGGLVKPKLRLVNQDKAVYYPDSGGHISATVWNASADTYAFGTLMLCDPTDVQDEQLVIECQGSESSSIDYEGRALWYGFGRHDHGTSPGILDWDGSERSPQHYPEDVDVVVNGTSLGYSFGDGTREFTKTVDVGGRMSPGWNEIRLTSSGLGHLDATFSADLFRQSL